ncbi:SpoIIE family protein phosphatase [Streptomyces fildesensis]|uniref:SpoIIE family protein phosphatase n=1 Tax=Streptomyces fildesensis TaxID=375757 RepID=A0ABW8C9Y1_9ACTN
MQDPLFHVALDQLPESQDSGYVIVDAHGMVVSWNRGAEQLLGRSADELGGLRAADLLHTPSDAARIVARCTAEPETSLGRTMLRREDGGPVAVMLWAHRLTPVAGERYWLLRGTDAEAVNQEDLGRALLQGLFTESPFVIDVFDTDLRFLAHNRTQRFRPGQSIGRTMREVTPLSHVDIDALEARQRHVLATGEALIATEVHGRSADDPEHDRVWSETIMPLRGRNGEVVGLAHAVANVTERARARERLALVNAASVSIGSTLDVLTTAQELTDALVPRLADYAYVNLLEPVFGGEEPAAGPPAGTVPLRRAATSSIPEGPAGPVIARGEIDTFTSGPGPLMPRILAGGEPLLLTGEELIAEITPIDPRRAAMIRETGVHSLLMVPMSARGAVLGAAVFTRFQHPEPFERDDILLAQEVVARAAVCIDNASRYTRERTTALALQRSLLPQRLPVLGSAETLGRYLPERGRAELGGAWFDVIPLSGARVAFVVGDVGSHGLHAAVTVGRLRTAVRTLADLDLSPEELLTRLDDHVHRSSDEGGDQDEDAAQGDGLAQGAAGTMCLYAVFDPVSRRCVMARAAHPDHPPPALLSVDGRVGFPDLPGGPPLGLGTDPFETGEVTLTDGDVLVLYTGRRTAAGDGHATRDRGDFRTALSDPPLPVSPGLGDLCEAVKQRLAPGGDAALLMARVHGLCPDRHVTWELEATPEVVGRARALVAAQLAAWGLEELGFSTELIVSELVTNAIRYGNPPIRLRLIRDRSLICEVSDGSSTSPHVRRALETDEGGRGLYLVAQVARIWGTRYHARGKTIWAEQPLPAGP